MSEIENSKKSGLDMFAEELQQQIIEEERAIFSDKVIAEYHNPYNIRRMKEPDGQAVFAGSCGDTMEFYVKVRFGKIKKITFITDGCESSVACGEMTSNILTGKSISLAIKIKRADILKKIGRFPFDSRHCALLAVNTAKAAIKNYREKKT